MAKKNKITKDELSKAQEVSHSFNNIISQLGNIRLLENDLVTKASQQREAVESMKKELQEKYGNVDIDLKTGEYSESDKKD
jgi:hypothetical protein